VAYKDPEARKKQHREYMAAYRAARRPAGPLERTPEPLSARKAALREYNIAWRRRRLAAESPEEAAARRFHNRLCKKGITVDQFHSMMERQDFACGICGTDIASGPTRSVHIDHDHATGQVRGLLCPRCNTGLGKMLDGRLLEAARRYLDRSAKRTAA
jgi:hypothetical protein